MNYQIIKVESMSQTQKHVIIDRGDGSFESFPADDNNSRYQQWLAEGNEPELLDDAN